MAKEIIWTPQAEKTHDAVIDYLNEEWSEKEVMKFIEKSDDVIKHISRYPMAYRSAGKDDVREAVVTKHNLLLYRISGQKIYIVYFWDTRKHPARKPKTS